MFPKQIYMWKKRNLQTKHYEIIYLLSDPIKLAASSFNKGCC